MKQMKTEDSYYSAGIATGRQEREKEILKIIDWRLKELRRLYNQGQTLHLIGEIQALNELIKQIKEVKLK